MKNKKIKILLLLFMFFILIIIKGPNAVYAKEYIIVGDSRTLGIYDTYFGAYNDQPIDITKTVNGNKVKFLAVVGVGYYHWFDNGTHYAQITRALSSASAGTNCLFWLGINDLEYVTGSQYVNAITQLVKKYPKINFYFCGVSGVYEGVYSEVSNSQIKSFNQNANSAVSSKSLSNFKYKEIGEATIKIGSQSKTVNGFINTRYYICFRWTTLFGVLI